MLAGPRDTYRDGTETSVSSGLSCSSKAAWLDGRARLLPPEEKRQCRGMRHLMTLIEPTSASDVRDLGQASLAVSRPPVWPPTVHSL